MIPEIKNISIDDYWYDLPDSRIAKYPLEKRDKSKLLLYANKNISQDNFENIANHLNANGLLISNNTKVIQARIELFKETGARIEVFCLEPYLPSDYNISFSETKTCQWLCIIGNLKKWKNGILTLKVVAKDTSTLLSVERIGTKGDAQIINFSWDNEQICFGEILESTGELPIPPYLNRQTENSDLERYQTIYSKYKGSVAAPTAGLHFTNKVFESLIQKGIKRHEITLHVGAGTFKPVKADYIGQHEMHHEQFIITNTTLPSIIKNLGHITAVGTTTVRTLESLYWLGVKIMQLEFKNNHLILDQWDAYQLPQDIPVIEALQNLNEHLLNSKEPYLTASTGIMIAPGYKFRVINQLITNFHQPKSTLLLLIAALMGSDWKKAYSFALENDFRFLSYGDSCLIKA